MSIRTTRAAGRDSATPAVLTSRTRAGRLVASVAVATLPLLPAAAQADGRSHPTKGQVEYAERVAATGRQATADHPTKARVEHAELPSAPGGPTTAREHRAPDRDDAGGGWATGWQLALSAAAGASVTGLVVAGGRRNGRGRAALAR
jgi:hypothetical protein